MTSFRFAVVPSGSWMDADLTALDHRVLALISAHCSASDRNAWPKQETIAGILGVARESVARSIGRLRDRGHINVLHQYRDGGGRAASLYYVPLEPWELTIERLESSGDPNVTHSVTNALGKCDPNGGANVTATITYNKNIPDEHKKEEQALPKKKAEKGISASDLREAVDAWNAMAKANDLPSVRGTDGQRAVLLKARLTDIGVDGWRALMSQIPASPFLMGRSGSNPWRNFRLDWLIAPANFNKVLEGAYHPNRRPLDLSSGAGAPANDGAMDSEKRTRLMRSAVEMVDDGTVSAWNPSWTNQLGVDYAGARAELAALERQPQPDLGLVLTTPQP